MSRVDLLGEVGEGPDRPGLIAAKGSMAAHAGTADRELPDPIWVHVRPAVSDRMVVRLVVNRSAPKQGSREWKGCRVSVGLVG
jgi:hypothetical protein